MTQRRLRQANLFGPAGFVSADDGEVIELSQQGFEQKPYHRTLAELGGRDVGDTDHMVTETLIRGMYEYWRKEMEALSGTVADSTSRLPRAGPAVRRLRRARSSSGDWDLWPEFFVDDCSTACVPRENHERGFPLATLSFESKGMLKRPRLRHPETLFHDPYYQRHVVGAPVVREVERRAHRERGELRRVPHQAQRSSRPCSTSAATSTSSCARQPA